MSATVFNISCCGNKKIQNPPHALYLEIVCPALGYATESYKDRLMSINLLPVSYWHLCYHLGTECIHEAVELQYIASFATDRGRGMHSNIYLHLQQTEVAVCIQIYITICICYVATFATDNIVGVHD